MACRELAGHAGPASQLEVVPVQPGLLVSASYDTTVAAWDAAAGRMVQRLQAHGAPVLQLSVAGLTAASGDREGSIFLHDLQVGRTACRRDGAHPCGHVTALAWHQDDRQQQALLASGGQDGSIKLWDGRAAAPVMQGAAHASAAGRGAVGGREGKSGVSWEGNLAHLTSWSLRVQTAGFSGWTHGAAWRQSGRWTCLTSRMR